jgi:hypothetical protein
VLADFFALTLAISKSLRLFAFEVGYSLRNDMHVTQLMLTFKASPQENYLKQTLTHLQAHSSPLLLEMQMLWVLKLQRICPHLQFNGTNSIIEYFVRREVTKRMAEEAKILEYHEMFPTKFKMKDQDLTELKIGKAMDEWTKEDKA